MPDANCYPVEAVREMTLERKIGLGVMDLPIYWLISVSLTHRTERLRCHRS